MKQLLCLLAVFCGTVSAATAGPNQGGVLWVHDTGIVFSTDLTLPPVSTPPADCAGVDNRQDVDGVERIWKVYAAFPPGSHPRLKVVGWATQFPEAATSASSYVNVTGGGVPDEDGPGTDFFIGDLGFPTASGGQIGQSFPFGPRTTTVVTLFYFYGFGYHASGPLPTWSTAPHSAPGNRVFGDDANPTNEDPIMGYGSLGFGLAGTTPCPISDPDAVCCAPEGDCTITKQAACAAPRVWYAEWYVCAPNPCPQPAAGACCFAGGACSMLMPAACAGAGGVFHDGACEPNPCPQPGACCFLNGSCSTLPQAACVATGGTFYDGPCVPNPCPQPPTGACCFAGGACSMLTPEGCANLGGAFLDGACEPNPCPQPGACCFPDGTCSTLQPATCASAGGSFLGGVCLPNPCPQPPAGACCFDSGECSMLTPAACASSGGVSYDGACTPNPCPQPPPTGACCFAGGACSMLPPAACAGAGGAFLDGACEPNPCPQPGACCFPDGTCSTLQPAACASAGGSFLGGACLPNPCPQAGACCFPNGSCSMLTNPACGAAGGVLYGGCCLPNPCPQPPTGACCFAGGVCSMLTPAACASSGGVFYDGACTPNPCPQQPPPGSGDTIASPLIVTGGLPFQGVGTTVGFNNDYDEACPYSGSLAPDVVYAYTADGSAASLTLDLCYSNYDTKLFVYQDAWTPGAPWACNDDFNMSAPCYTYSSKIVQMPVTSGHVYYIVIDGYGSQSGSYHLDITDAGMVPPSGACCAASGGCTITQAGQCAGTWQGENTVCVPNPCPIPEPVPCPAGSLIEGEPTCQDNYMDNYNGGCNSTPVIWQSLAPQAGGCGTICGKSCTYLLNGGSNRDTDWYLSNSAGGTVAATVTAEFPVMIALFYANITDCAAIQYTYVLGAEYTPTSVSYSIAFGNQVGFFVANQGFSGYPAELGYVLNVCGLNPLPPPPGACCNGAGTCIMTTPEQCAFSGGSFVGGPCIPNPCASIPTESTSWGAIKARFLHPAARAEGVVGRSGSCEPAGVTPKPAITPRSPGSSGPALLSATRPPKPGSAGLRGGK